MLKNIIDIIEHFGGNVGDDEALTKLELKTIMKKGYMATDDRKLLDSATDDQKLLAAETARCKAHAIAFLK